MNNYENPRTLYWWLMEFPKPLPKYTVFILYIINILLYYVVIKIKMFISRL